MDSWFCDRLLEYICKLFRDAAFTFSYHHAEFTAVTYYIYKHKCFAGTYTTCKTGTKPPVGLTWHIFHILMSADVDDIVLI